MKLPISIPEQDPSAIWSLQIQLLEWAEELLGKRDESKIIYQPTFNENGPHIRNSYTLDGAHSELSLNSKSYWPTVLYEMAHETVHLLNPTVGTTNWLEEGIAVEFSIYAQLRFNLNIQYPTNGPYFEALTLVRLLPDGPFLAANRTRELAGGLSKVTIKQLHSLFPEIENTVLRQLSSQFMLG